MKHISHSLQFRANCINNFKEQKDKNSYKQTSKDKLPITNTKIMKQAIEDHGVYHNTTVNQGLWNFLAQKEATPEQYHDLLKHRQIGELGYEEFVRTKILKKPSINVPHQKKTALYIFCV